MAAAQALGDPAGAAAPDPANRADLELIARIRAGQHAAWSELIVRYQDRLFAVCVKMVHDRELAADLTQDSFVKLLQGIDSFDGRSKFSTWAIRVCMNVCLSRLRAEKLRRHASLDAPTQSARSSGPVREAAPSWGESMPAGAGLSGTREPDGSLGVETREERADLLAALRLLDPEQRAVLILCDCRGLPYDQIGQVLGVAVGTVKSRVFRARTALRDAVERIQRERSQERSTTSPRRPSDRSA